MTYDNLLQIPNFTSIDISQGHEFKPMITDVGLCHVYNGNTITQTFKSAGRNHDLIESFEQDERGYTPVKINGTGFQKQKTFWFDVGFR